MASSIARTTRKCSWCEFIRNCWTRNAFRAKKKDKLWERRFEEINNFERYLVNNGIEILKFFFHLSKDEQRKRFLARLDSADKNWKFSSADVKERAFWDDYIGAFEEMLSHTSTDHAPWHVIPANHKWFTHVALAEIINHKLSSMDIDYPKLDADQRRELDVARKYLEDEK